MMIRTPSIVRYAQSVCVKLRLIQGCVCGKNWPIVGGNAITAAAKMIGMTPAMFTRSGR